MNNNTGRKRVRRARKNESIKRILLTVCMMAMVAALSIGGTLAWLTDKTTEVTNTFTPSNIKITLAESDYDKTTDALVGDPIEGHQESDYHLVPGKAYPKNPTVTVVRPTTDVDVYLFVKFEASTSATYLDYTHIWDTDTTNWQKLTGVDGVDNVWYRTVLATETNPSYVLLNADTNGMAVTVKSTLKKEDMPTTNPTMKYTAYAIQTEGTGTAAEAWAKIGN